MWDMKLDSKEWENEVQWLGLENTSINPGSTTDDVILYYLIDYQLLKSDNIYVLNH